MYYLWASSGRKKNGQDERLPESDESEDDDLDTATGKKIEKGKMKPFEVKEEFWSNGRPAHFGSPADIYGVGSPGSPGAQKHEMY